tara:strand:- start:1263 stop:2186 length:924 start_codon:yes stop_codon:yes gene_type:complete
MADIFGYGEKDQHIITYSLIIVVSIFCLFFINLFDIVEILDDRVVSLDSKFISEEILTTFRTLCTILAFYTIFVLMIFNKEGGSMNPLFHNERITKNHKTMGLERMVPFSSWNLIIFGLYFFTVSALGWFELFDINSSKFLYLSSGMLLPMSLGMSMLTATVVTYVIIPNEVNSDREYDYLFKMHEMVMHNLVVILISVDVILSQPDLKWQLAIFGLVIGVIYITFAYFFALYGGGYYVYSFIDPRIKYGPIIMIILALAISLFYILIWLISLLLEYNLLIGVPIYMLWNYSVVLFKKPIRDSQSSS